MGGGTTNDSVPIHKVFRDFVEGIDCVLEVESRVNQIGQVVDVNISS